MSVHSDPAPAVPGRRRFTVSTQLMPSPELEAPVCGATQIVTARTGGRFRDLVSIGSDGHLVRFTRDAVERWTRVRLPWAASALAVVAQRDGTDRVFFAELVERSRGGKTAEKSAAEKSVTVYEMEFTKGEPGRRLHGRFTTSDPRVYGITALRGLQCRDGSSLLATTLETYPRRQGANWLVLFGHGSSTGAQSLAESRGVVADRVAIAEGDPGSTRWPHVTLVLRDDDRLRLEWGARGGVLLQTERLPIPELAGVVDADVVRDHGGRLRIFALDRDGRLYVLSQVGGGGALPPRWAGAWSPLPATAGGPRTGRPALRRLRAVRRGDGDIELIALDDRDRLWSIAERPAGAADGWGELQDLGIHAAHFAVGATAGRDLELFVVSRQNRLHWLRRDRRGNWRLDRVASGDAEAPRRRHVYHTGLKVVDQDHGGVPGVPVSVTATERVASLVNGLSYAISPIEPVVAETDASGTVHVAFELAGRRSVPSLSFESELFEGGLLAVCPERKAHLFFQERGERLLRPGSRPRIHLIPEDTLIEQS